VVLGFALTDRVIVQRLTDFIWVGIDSTLSRAHVNRVARIFYALKTSLDKLKSYYVNHTIDSLKPAPTRYFPSITTYGKGPRQCVRFKYLGYLESSFDCVTLHAKTDTKPTRDIVVKFVERYSERAHRILAKARLAPQLLYYGPVHCDPKQPSYNSLYMVVMEYIDGFTYASAKLAMTKARRATVRSELDRALRLLHENGLVFGDLRAPNVMITKQKEQVMLIDFDWAGEAGQVQYPHLLSSVIEWPQDVQALDPIKKEHDLEMLEKLFD
jgi:serine/threonine protein kinase